MRSNLSGLWYYRLFRGEFFIIYGKVLELLIVFMGFIDKLG